MCRAMAVEREVNEEEGALVGRGRERRARIRGVERNRVGLESDRPPAEPVLLQIARHHVARFALADAVFGHRIPFYLHEVAEPHYPTDLASPTTALATLNIPTYPTELSA